MLGAQTDPYLLQGEWSVFVNYRHLYSDRHFNGIEEQTERQEIGNEVHNKQRILDLGATYAVNRQFNVTLGVPILIYGSWSIPLPINPPGTRFVQSAKGLGDITLTGRYWLLDCERHQDGNVALGLGVKFPTGDDNAKDLFPTITGANPTVKPVDISVQPGDGGFGIILDLSAFKQVGSVTVFASGSYLINPRDTNGTPSIIDNLFGGSPPPQFAEFAVNSVPDQYLARIGAGVPIKGVEGLSITLAARIEGSPPSDLIGDSNGFRRPGYSIFIEPGLIYTRGRHTLSFSAPVATHRNRQANANGFEGDATFADHFFLVGYSYRFGGSRGSAASAPPAAASVRTKAKGTIFRCNGCDECRKNPPVLAILQARPFEGR